MTFLPHTDIALEIARGNISGLTAVNKFGRTFNADSAVDTDIWDGADLTTLQPIWLAPTAARIHDIASASASDAAAGVGLRTVRIYGLKTWSSKESTEVVTLNGVTNVATVNSYVIIHRLEALTWGGSGANVGAITATAQTDATISAKIEPLKGQTQMAIYGIPSTQTAYLPLFYGSHNKSGGTKGEADLSLLVNPSPDILPNIFITKHTTGTLSGGSSHLQHKYNPYKKIPGPAIIKIQVITDTNNIDVSGGFDIILSDN